MRATQKSGGRRRRPKPKPKPKAAPPPVLKRRTPPAQLLGSGLIPSDYDTQAANLRGDYANTLADLDQQQTSLFRDAGFKGTIDPTTGAVTYGVDPTAQFGQYQTMLRGLADNLATARQDAMSRGLGGGGLAAARGNLARFATSQDQANMMHNFMDTAAGIFRSRGEALQTMNRGLQGLEAGAQDWWNQNGPEDYAPQQAPVNFQNAKPMNIQQTKLAHKHLTRMIQGHYFPRRHPGRQP